MISMQLPTTSAATRHTMRSAWSRCCSSWPRAIAEQPQAGRIVPELGNVQIRERFLYSYRVLYEIDEQRIDILAVIHGKRLLESIEDRFTEDRSEMKDE